jgi:cell division inhibitor SepF
MSAFRRAGVWLGLVEEDDDQGDDGGFDDEFAEDEDYAPPRPRPLSRPSARLSDRDRDIVDNRDRDRDLRASDRDNRDTRGTELRGADSGVDARTSDTRTTGYERPTARDRAPETPRASVRPLGRPTPAPHSSGVQAAYAPSVSAPPAQSRSFAPTSGTTTFPTQDNLALAPQVQLRERAIVTDETTRRPQITTLHPTTYSEARTIGEHFREGNPVIMNLTEMDEPDAKRLVDFAAGLAFGVRGSMERVTNRVFLLSPPNIQVSAEDKARIAEGGFFDRA